MVTKGIYLFWDKKYEQVIYGGRFTGRKRIKQHFNPSKRNEQQINKYIQNHPERIDSVIFCEFDDISDDDLNQLEMETIKLFKLNRYRYPDSHVFNFTDGGGGSCGFVHSEESKKKIGKANSGENNPRAKYTLWDITKCHYDKSNMFRHGNDGKNPRRCFIFKYNGKILHIGSHLDFYTPELINDLINEFLEVS